MQAILFARAMRVLGWRYRRTRRGVAMFWRPQLVGNAFYYVDIGMLDRLLIEPANFAGLVTGSLAPSA